MDTATQKNLVLRSIETPDGQHCMDLFRRPDGSHGFEEYRRDPEDVRGWYPAGHFGARRFADADAALRAALAAIHWLEDAMGADSPREPWREP